MRFPWNRMGKDSPIVETIFPDGSIKVGLNSIDSLYEVSLRSHDDIWRLLLINNILVRQKRTARLFIKYLMYQQDDRIFDREESFGLQVLADVLNSLEGFSEISILDPHSDVVNLIRNVIVVTPEEYIEESISLIGVEDLCVLTPDAGAYKKYYPMIPEGIPVYSCSKVRDNEGNITIAIPNYIKEGKVLIVDDICLGGKTHITIAEKLEGKKCYLYVTHGVFNQGIGDLGKVFSKIITTDSITEEDFPVTILK